MKDNPIIAITGVSSFIGANLAVKYASEGFNVIGLVSESKSTYSNIRKKRLDLCEEKGVKLHEFDLKDENSIKYFFKQYKVDYFIHHAAWVKDANSLHFDLDAALSVNVLPLRIIFEELSKSSAKGIIVTGTNAEYGDKKNGCKESDICLPTTPYGLSKLCMTLTSFQLFNEFKLPTRIARIFNPLGALDNPKKLLPSIIHQISLNKTFDLSNCLQKRDFIYIGDLINGYYKLSEDLDRKDFDIFNLCSGEAISVKDLLESIAKKMGKDNSLLNFGALPMRPGEPLIAYGNNQKAIDVLGWKASSIKDQIDVITKEILNEY